MDTVFILNIITCFSSHNFYNSTKNKLLNIFQKEHELFPKKKNTCKHFHINITHNSPIKTSRWVKGPVVGRVPRNDYRNSAILNVRVYVLRFHLSHGDKSRDWLANLYWFYTRFSRKPGIGIRWIIGMHYAVFLMD